MKRHVIGRKPTPKVLPKSVQPTRGGTKAAGPSPKAEVGSAQKIIKGKGTGILPKGMQPTRGKKARKLPGGL